MVLPFLVNDFCYVIVVAAEVQFLFSLNVGALGISTEDLTIFRLVPFSFRPPWICVCVCVGACVALSWHQIIQKKSSHSQRAGPHLPGVRLCVIAVQAVSRGATLTAAVAAGAAVAVGWRQLRNCCIGQAVPLFTYKDKGRNIKRPRPTLSSRILYSRRLSVSCSFFH